MLKNNKSLFFVVAALLLVSMVGVKAMNSGQDQSKTAEKNTPELKQVDSEYVCMVTDRLFSKEQIPVEVEGKTYYGCCEMCKGRLANDPDVRKGIDPLSKNRVDKAQSVKAANSEGEIFYFENKQNLTEFNNK